MTSRTYLAALFICMVSLVPVIVHGNKKSENACNEFGLTPFFDPKLVLGPQWRIYYTWNIRKKHAKNCLAMKFYPINPTIFRRFKNDMGPYLMQQPTWTAAMLYMTMGAAKDEMLLFATFGPAGRVQGVPYLARSFIRNKKKKTVSLFQYHMKLIHGGQYLVIMDCLTGWVMLSTRDIEVPPYRIEILWVAKKLGLGRGSLSCQKMRNATELPADYH